MSQIIAGIYEIEERIGSGGGGIVYLGHHLRLKKKVVLKADKRTLKTGSEELRREVDLLKELSHTYIPQVYDFVQENGIVYTVMDYIDGESLDRRLARNELPTQPQAIQWACQLLEALSYLHSRPPHGILHGDIKPANIMLRGNGDICLIDFNIALALGEDGAVKVGFSRGYASPEHYGADYISARKAEAAVHNADSKADLYETETYESEYETETDSKNSVKLDVRSDIYSLGATLYHLISGKRPAQNAVDVEPLGEELCSPAVSAILQKAMSPVPENRYQSSEDMLNAFISLHQSDKRVVRHKRHIRTASAVLVSIFMLGGVCAFTGLKQLEQYQTALALAEYSANALEQGDIVQAVDTALQAIPTGKSIFEPPVTAQAQKALTDALGVYDLSDGFKSLETIELPSAPFDIVVSPDGSRFAAVYAFEVAVYSMETRQKLALLPTQNSALSDIVFVDEDRIIYAGDKGVTMYDISANSVIWTGEPGTGLTISSDRRTVAAVNRDADHAVIYHVSDGTIISECPFNGMHMAVAVNDIFADPENDVFALNEDGSKLAVSFSNGGLIIFDLIDPDSDIIIYEQSDYRHFEGGFYEKYFAFAAQKNGEAQFGLIDTVEAAYAGGYSTKDDILLLTDESGIYLADGNLLVSVNPEIMEETELAYTNGMNITGFSAGGEYCLVSTDDNTLFFYDAGANISSKVNCSMKNDFLLLTDEYAVIGSRNEPTLRIMKLEKHDEAQLLSYNARYPHDEARLSSDKKTVMLFSFRGFCIYDMNGMIIAQEELPDAEAVYDQQFVRNEADSWLEVTWYDGTVRRYSAADGTLLSEEKTAAPSKDLYEEFYTDKYRIASPLHTAPEVYAVGSDKLLTTLEEEAYLTYVTQTGEYIITEYISSEGERYGILLDDKLQQLARLPNLCDVYGDDTLIFDYDAGILRQCRLYSLQELMALGEAFVKAP